MRGRSRAGRLRGFDAWLVSQHLSASLIFDVGLGDRADTTAELAEVTGARVIGFDVELARVDAARAQFPSLEFRHLPAGELPNEKAGVIRLLNVLRGYTAEAAAEELERWRSVLEPGGLLLEGSCDPSGSVGCAQVLRDGARALLFLTDFQRGFAPWQLRDWLPRYLRREVKPGSAIHEFFQRWTAAFTGRGPDGFATAADALGLPHGVAGTHSWLLKPD